MKLTSTQLEFIHKYIYCANDSSSSCTKYVATFLLYFLFLNEFTLYYIGNVLIEVGLKILLKPSQKVWQPITLRCYTLIGCCHNYNMGCSF